MSIIRQGIKIYKQEGIQSLIERSTQYLIQKLFPKPTVSNHSTPRPVWTLKYLYNAIFTVKYGRGIEVMKEDWDTLILLDACRYDDFEDLNHLDGNLTAKISKGVDSKEFICRNFVGREFHDTVYVTANPHVSLIGEDVFHDIITEPISNWDPDVQAVRPKEVTNAGIKAHKKYPNKRIIVHYMQPHDPPLGVTGDALRKENDIGGAAPGENSSNKKRVMELVVEDKIPEDTARKAYRETLQIALEEVERLLDEISGNVVISADHGEMFGESPLPLLGDLYEHYQNPKTMNLCRVPWLRVDTQSNRREITSEESDNKNDFESEEIDDQLEALGYK